MPTKELAEMMAESFKDEVQFGTVTESYLHKYTTKQLVDMLNKNVADRINYMRFLSHFRAIHRGSFWTKMRSTEVRKLRPESWGFLCPVHTPDGAPCGLLNRSKIKK